MDVVYEWWVAFPSLPLELEGNVIEREKKTSKMIIFPFFDCVCVYNSDIAGACVRVYVSLSLPPSLSRFFFFFSVLKCNSLSVDKHSLNLTPCDTH